MQRVFLENGQSLQGMVQGSAPAQGTPGSEDVTVVVTGALCCCYIRLITLSTFLGIVLALCQRCEYLPPGKGNGISLRYF